jgi:hypothetical protein
MTRSPIPPRGKFISSRLLFHSDMPAAVLVTLIQLVALSWNSPKGMTAPLTHRALADLTSKSVRSIYGHLSALQNKYAALRLQSTGDGIFVVILADWVLEPPKPGEFDCKSLQTPVKEEEDSILESRIEIPPLPPDSDQEEECEGKPQKNAKFGKHKPLHKSMRVLSPELREELLAAGIFSTLLDEVAVSPYSEEDLRALLAWSEQDKPDNLAGFFMYRLRARAKPPEAFLQPPCPQCGMAGGKHKDNCGRRYISGSYAEFIED